MEGEDLGKRVSELEKGLEVQAATQAGAETTQAAAQAGTWSTMLAGAAGLVIGMFLGLALTAAARS